MKIYVIGIRRKEEKLAETIRLASNIGFHPEEFYGLDGAVTGLATTSWTYELDNPGSDYHIGPFPIGCCLSHWSMWSALSFSKTDEDYHFICEDDVRFKPGSLELVKTAIDELPSNWDMLYVGSCCASKSNGFEPSSNNVYKGDKILCTHAYVVRRKALPMLLERCEKVWAPIDIAISELCHEEMEVYAILPRLADQDDTVLIN